MKWILAATVLARKKKKKAREIVYALLVDSDNQKFGERIFKSFLATRQFITPIDALRTLLIKLQFLIC